MMLVYFFEMPVYRLAEERYYSEREAYVERTMYPPDDPWTPSLREFYKQHRDQRIQFQDHLERQYGGMWRYNEVIGYIRLHFLGSQIRGEYFSVKRRRLVRTRTKLFEYRIHKLAPEIHVPADPSSKDLFELTNEYLRDCQRELPGRHIDTELLETIGPYVDWRSVYRDQLRGNTRSKPHD